MSIANNAWKEQYNKLWIKNPQKQKDIELFIEENFISKDRVKQSMPEGWRLGQTIFNFLEWLGASGYAPRINTERLSDTFHLSDEKIKELYAKFMVKGKEY